MTGAHPEAASPPDDLGIVDALAQLLFLVQAALGSRAAAHDLSIIQVRLLGILRDREPSMNQLASLLGLDKSSISGLVDRASQRGLVTRKPSPHDRRATHVSMTAKGRRLARKVEQEFQGDVTSMTGALTPSQRGTLSRLASIVVTNA